MGPRYLSHLFSKSIIPYQLRDDNKLIQPLKRTTSFGIKYFAYFGTHLWNMLPQHIKNSVSLYNFKSLIRKWSGPTCCCSVCTQVVWFRYCLYKSILWHMFFPRFTRLYMENIAVTCSFLYFYTSVFVLPTWSFYRYLQDNLFGLFDLTDHSCCFKILYCMFDRWGQWFRRLGDFVVVGGTVSRRCDDLRCRRWRRGCRVDDLVFSDFVYMLCIVYIAFIKVDD